MKSFPLEIMIPSRCVYKDTVDMVVVPADNGFMGILAGHTPLLAQLEAGPVKVTKGSNLHTFQCGAGLVEVKSERVTILVDSAEEMENDK